MGDDYGFTPDKPAAKADDYGFTPDAPAQAAPARQAVTAADYADTFPHGPAVPPIDSAPKQRAPVELGGALMDTLSPSAMVMNTAPSKPSAQGIVAPPAMQPVASHAPAPTPQNTPMAVSHASATPPSMWQRAKTAVLRETGLDTGLTQEQEQQQQQNREQFAGQMVEQVAGHPLEAAGNVAFPGVGSMASGTLQAAADPGHRVEGAVKALTGAGEAVAPFIGPAAIEAAEAATVAPALKLGASMLTSPAGGYAGKKLAQEANLSPEGQQAAEQAGEFIGPGIVGAAELARPEIQTINEPDIKGAYGSAFGGKVAAAGKVTPEEIRVGGRVGPFQGSVAIPRTPAPAPPAPPVAGLLPEEGSAFQSKAPGAEVPPVEGQPTATPVTDAHIEDVAAKIQTMPVEQQHAAVVQVTQEVAKQIEQTGSTVNGEIVLPGNPAKAETAAKKIIEQKITEAEQPAAPQEQTGARVASRQPDVSRGTPSTPQADRRTNPEQRQRVAEMSPDEMRRTLLVSDKTGLPNRRAFDEAQHAPAPAVAISDADGLKAFNDKFGYAAGDQLLQAKADALREAGVEAYHDKGDEFLYRGESPDGLSAGLEKARAALRNREFEFTLPDGTVKILKGADFSYGVSSDLTSAEAGLKQHKADREARGERARGELRGIVEISKGNEGATPAQEVGASGVPAGQAPYTYKPITRETIPSGTRFYHGTQSGLTDLHQADPVSHWGEGNIYGPGLYLTDNPNVASGYTTKGTTGNGKVLFDDIGGAKVVDAEKPMSPEIKAAVQPVLDRMGIDWVPEGASLSQAYQEIRDESANQRIPTYEVQEDFDQIAERLSKLGYDGLRHEGGKTVGKKYGPHNVVVLFPDYKGGQGTAFASRLRAEGKITTAPIERTAPSGIKEGQTVVFDKVPPGSYLTVGEPVKVTGVSAESVHFTDPKTGGSTYEKHDALALAKFHVENSPAAPAPKAETKTKYKHGSTQAAIPHDSEAGKALASARQAISPGDLMPTGFGGDQTTGLETDPHVTLRYGIKGDDTEGIRAYIEAQAPFEAMLGKTASFPPSEHSDGAAPIIAPVNAPELHRMNAEIEKHGDFAPSSFPDFKPHATIAYVDPEKASRYVGMSVTDGKKFTVSSISITDRNGVETKVQLKGKATAPDRSGEAGTTLRSGFLDPAAFKAYFPALADRFSDWVADEPDAGDRQRAMMRETRGEKDRSLAQAAEKLKVMQKAWRMRPRRDTVALVNAVEQGDISSLPQKDQELAATNKALFDQDRAELQEVKPEALQNYIENYFPRIWKNPARAADIIKQVFLGKRPFAGSGNFLKQRTVPTFQDGLDMGLEPATWNPVDLMLLKHAEMQQFIMAHKTLDMMKEAGTAQFVRIGSKPPADWTKLDDRMGTVYGRESIVDQDKLDDATFNLTFPGGKNKMPGAFREDIDEATHTGTVIRGYYYAPNEAAKVFNNFVSRGMAGRSQVYDAAAWLNNNLNALQLGISAFHATTTSINAAMSDIALGVQQLTQGKPLQSGMSLGKGLALAPSIISTFRNGSKLMQEYLTPGSYAKFAEEANAVADAGGRIRQNTIEIKPLDKAINALRNGAILEGISSIPGAIIDATTRPIMEWYVPRMKMGAFYSMAHNILDTATREGWTKEQTRARMQKAWDSIDNRFGQMVYDNLFWHKGLRDALQLATRSVGWNFGTIRELGGVAPDVIREAAKAAGGKRPEVTDRMAFAFALAATTAMIGAALTYLWTGEKPKSWKDYYFPRTADGTRVSIPGYAKDVVAYGFNPVGTIAAKMSPIIALAHEAIQNRDFYGTEIRHKDDPAVKQFLQFAQFAGRSAMPFAFSGARRLLGREGEDTSTLGSTVRAGMRHPADVLRGQFGFQPAPAYIQNSKALNDAREYGTANRPPGTRTEEQTDRSNAMRSVEDMYRAHNVNQDTINRYVQDGRIGRRDVAKAAVMSRVDPIVWATRGLSLEQAMNVYSDANEQERRTIRPLLAHKFESAQPADRARLRDSFRALMQPNRTAARTTASRTEN